MVEAEVDRVESQMLIEDVKERSPDPLKLIILRNKMGQIIALMENLATMNDNTPELKVLKKREKNRLASKCCRLKKKAQFEANVLVYDGLMKEKRKLVLFSNNSNKLCCHTIEDFKQFVPFFVRNW